MLVYENLDQNNAIENRDVAVELVKFLIWSITDGQELANTVGFARIPDSALNKNFEMIKQIKWKEENIGEMQLEKMEVI